MVGRWAPYVPVAQRRRQAASELVRLTKSGQATSPIIIKGRAIATTPWGRAWCAHMEQYSDYANRLPRGRTYVRNGSVIDLQITSGQVVAKVSGSSIYRITIAVQPVPNPRWQQICADCAGSIDSLVELLQGRLSKAVMDRLCRQGDGLFPAPRDIRLSCSCPDSAAMCKHVAAVLYGVGSRLDHQPELLFVLRQVDASELLSKPGSGVLAANVSGGRVLAGDDLSALFGLDMEGASALVAPAPGTKTTSSKPTAPSRTRAPVRPTQVAPPKAKPQPRSRSPAARLLAALLREGWLDNAAARAATGLDAEPVRLLLKRLVADGHARVEGQKRGTRYVAIDRPQTR